MEDSLNFNFSLGRGLVRRFNNKGMLLIGALLKREVQSVSTQVSLLVVIFTFKMVFMHGTQSSYTKEMCTYIYKIYIIIHT